MIYEVTCNYFHRLFLQWMLLFPRFVRRAVVHPGDSVVKKLYYLFCSSVVSLVLISSAFSQAGTVAKSGPNNPLSAPKSTKAVSVENIEQDVAEALSVIESNHVVGKKINYNDVFKSSIERMLQTLDPHSNY